RTANSNPKDLRLTPMRVRGTVSQTFSLHGVRTNLCPSRNPDALQDEILRYSETCATFRFGPQKEHPRHPRYPRSSPAFGSGYATFEFRNSAFTGAWSFQSSWRPIGRLGISLASQRFNRRADHIQFTDGCPNHHDPGQFVVENRPGALEGNAQLGQQLTQRGLHLA